MSPRLLWNIDLIGRTLLIRKIKAFISLRIFLLWQSKNHLSLFQFRILQRRYIQRFLTLFNYLHRLGWIGIGFRRFGISVSIPEFKVDLSLTHFNWLIMFQWIQLPCMLIQYFDWWMSSIDIMLQFLKVFIRVQFVEKSQIG